MKYPHLPAMLIVLASLLSTSIFAQASVAVPHIQLAQKSHPDLNSAIQSVKQRTKGKVLSAKTVTIKGQTVYKIKVLLPSGKVQTFKIAAQ